ncbi:integrase [Streptomyces sp. NPDC005708]|uniref:integrase n=1 Tax=Streptomyces sp. NPDC005708 TaxID=3154564 RepID=UPI0033D6A035
MFVSLVYEVARKLLSVPAALVRRRVAKDAVLLVLQHKNAILRRQLTSPARNEPTEELWFAALSGLIPRRRLARVFPLTPATLLAGTEDSHASGTTASAGAGRSSRRP